MSTITLWEWRQDIILDPDLGKIVGFGVEAQDGSIGKIDEATNEAGASYIVVDTGPWIFGKKVMIPANMIDRIDLDNEDVYVAATKEQIKNAPEFDEDSYRDQPYRERLGDYYGHR
jgi:hypothetical protein